MTSSRSDHQLSPICDWLDVTFGPKDCPYPTVNRLLLEAGFDVVDSRSDSVSIYLPPKPHRGKLTVEQRSSWARISASGGACEFLRLSGFWGDYLSELSSSPHQVTRVDLALDLAMDGADLVAAMHARYGGDPVYFCRKGVQPSRILRIRPDGRETGTWYAGYRSAAQVTGKVYDKAFQMLEVYGEKLPPTARVEITVRKGLGATLRDAAEPAALFWHTASPALLKAPEDAPMWQPNSDLGWTAEKREFDPAALLRRRVESLAELDALALVADDLGEYGRAYLLKLLETRLGPFERPSAQLQAAV